MKKIEKTGLFSVIVSCCLILLSTSTVSSIVGVGGVLIGGFLFIAGDSL